MNLSIVVPIYNAEKSIEKCLNAIFNSITSNDEIILINDASTDSTLQIISSYDCKIITNKLNCGAGAARNMGVQIAQKDIIVFVDSDIVITKDHIESIKKYFIENQNIQTITARLSDEKKNRFFSDFKNLYMNFIILEGELSVNYVYGSLCATRKMNYVSWPEDIRLIEDSMWGYKQTKLGFVIHLLKNITPVHLKEYSFYELIKNDFKVSTNFAKVFFQNKRWNTLYNSNEKFGHTSKKQKISVILAVVTLLLSFINISFGAFLFGVWILLNTNFFKFLYRKRSFSFSLKSIAWYYFSNIIYFAGILHGFSLAAGEAIKNKFREVT